VNWAVDASLAAAFVLPDERSDTADAFFSAVEQGVRLWIPQLWWIEMANTLLMASRRKRLSADKILNSLSSLESLPLSEDDAPCRSLGEVLTALAVKHRLTAYDAVYLELAQRRRIGLATLDKKLATAARKERIEVYGET
jgi:predicted nucleic acid-binding protein